MNNQKNSRNVSDIFGTGAGMKAYQQQVANKQNEMAIIMQEMHEKEKLKARLVIRSSYLGRREDGGESGDGPKGQ